MRSTSWSSLAVFTGISVLICSQAEAGMLGSRTTLDFKTESFFSRDYSVTSARSFYAFGVDLNSEPSPVETPALIINVRGEVTPQTSELSYINAKEFYYRSGDISLGRKILSWSQTDDNWHLGIIQPQFRWNPLLPGTQGLVGGFLEHREKSWGFVLYGSPLFLPDQGPGFVMHQGQFQAVNPWFQYQPSTVRLTGSSQARTLDYELQIPPLDRFLLSTGGGGQIYFGNPEDLVSVRMAGAYKPSNQLGMGLNFTGEPTERAHIFIAPTVFYHNVASLDFSLHNTSWRWNLGALYEAAKEPLGQKNGFAYVTYRPMTLTSTSLSWMAGPTEIQMSGLWRRGGEAQGIGPESHDVSSFFPERIPYRDAAKITLKQKFELLKRQALELSLGYLQGLSSGFSQIHATGGWSLDRNWSLQTSVLLVTADDRSPSLYRDLEDNDSIKLGVNYVF